MATAGSVPLMSAGFLTVSNLKVHRAIMASPLLQRYGGTVMTKLHTDVELKEYLDGPDEVVIFMNRVRDRLVFSGIHRDEDNY
jgi:hypothetical protein